MLSSPLDSSRPYISAARRKSTVRICPERAPLNQASSQRGTIPKYLNRSNPPPPSGGAAPPCGRADTLPQPSATMSLAATFVFLLVSALQMLDRVLDLARKRGSITDEQLKLRLQINQILKEASALSTPSTFAHAAKLKRLAAAKEKELAKLQEQDIKGKQSLHNQYGRVSHQIHLVIGSNLRFTHSVVLECSCNHCSQTSSTAFWTDVFLERC
ncbi:hypothetical protein GUJ93_ZPchr0006g45892 [Zizania palustris]|uniref:Uncharacterized protein n=1 Tax=Zizania palustris TaxID=103762 RepID=A0A8J5W3W0_ZIZPA|nr:hypothetical protein GUJ93_ZPchr0006g45892 [Zizania palustris]